MPHLYSQLQWLCIACPRNLAFCFKKMFFLTILDPTFVSEGYMATLFWLLLLWLPCYAHLETMALFQEVLMTYSLRYSAPVILPILSTTTPIWKLPSPELWTPCFIYIHWWLLKSQYMGRQPVQTNK